MTIKEAYEAIAADLQVNFLYGSKSDINIQGDGANFPAIILIEPDDIGFEINVQAGTAKDTEATFIQFVNIVDMTQQAESRVSTVRAMRTLAAKFVMAVAQSTTLSINAPGNVISVRGTLVVDAYDVNVAGIEINLPVKLDQPEDICAPE